MKIGDVVRTTYGWVEPVGAHQTAPPLGSVGIITDFERGNALVTFFGGYTNGRSVGEEAFDQKAPGWWLPPQHLEVIKP